MKTLVGLYLVAVYVVIIMCVIGWAANIVKLCNCDFKEPYKAEVIRLVGIPCIPVGIVCGYLEIEDK